MTESTSVGLPSLLNEEEERELNEVLTTLAQHRQVSLGRRKP